MFFNIGTKIYNGSIEIEEILEFSDEINNNFYTLIYITSTTTNEKYLWKKIVNGSQVIEYDCSILFN